MTVTLEQLLTHPDAFGLTTATPVQRAICRVCDGLPLGELAGDPDVRWALGEEQREGALSRIPVGRRPQEVFLVGAVRGAKTLISSAIAFRSAITCDVSGLRRGEIPRYSVMSLDLDKAKVALEHLNETIPIARLLRPFFIRAKGDTIVVRHPSGRPVEIKVVAGKRAGGALVSRWSAGATFDEAPRMQGQEDGIINFDEARKAVVARLLPGAQVFAPGSPWAPRGPVFDAVEQEWGKPTRARVVIRARGPMLNPYWWTTERIEAIRASQDGELVVQTDCFAEFGDLESQFFTAADIRGATREGPMREGYDDECSYAAFMDPATRGNGWTLVVVARRAAEAAADARYSVVLAHEWRGSKLAPLKAKQVFAEMKELLGLYQLSSVTTDKWSADMIAEHGEAAGVMVEIDDATEPEKAKRYLALRELVVAAPPGISLPPEPVLRADLLSIRKQLTPAGMRFPLPTTGDGRHADYAPSTAGAVAKAAEGPTWIDAMRKRNRARAA